jgi:hypothetical protein
VDVEPTLTPELNPAFSLTFLIGGVLLLAAELWGVRARGKGDTLTEHWQFADLWLKARYPMFRWGFRVFTVGTLGWAALHFIAGSS